MKRGSTLFLRLAVILIGLPILALCIFLVPNFANFAAGLYPDITYINYLVYIVFYGGAIPFYIALYHAFKLLNYIDKNIAFSDLSIKALKAIKFCALIISGLFAATFPLFYLIAEKVDPPGVLPIDTGIIFASLVIAVFAAVLQRLLNESIAIKSENDLTI